MTGGIHVREGANDMADMEITVMEEFQEQTYRGVEAERLTVFQPTPVYRPYGDGIFWHIDNDVLAACDYDVDKAFAFLDRIASGELV